MILPLTLIFSILINLILAQSTTVRPSNNTTTVIDPAPTSTGNTTLSNITLPLSNSTLPSNSTSTPLNKTTTSITSSTSYQTASIPAQFTGSITAFSPQNTVSGIYSGPNDNYIASEGFRNTAGVVGLGISVIVALMI